MLAIFDWFCPRRDSLHPHPQGEDEAARLSCLGVKLSLGVTCAALAMFISRFLIEGNASGTLYIILLGVGAGLVLAFYIKYTGNYRITSHVIALLGIGIIIPIRVLSTGGLGSAVLSWFFPVEILLFAVGSLKYAYVGCALIVVEVIALLVATRVGWYEPDFIPTDLIQATVFLFALGLSVLVVGLYEKGRIENQRLLRRKNEIIAADVVKLEEQKHDLEEAMRDREFLISVLSHDVCNQLTLILGLSSVLQESESLTEEMDGEFVDGIQRAALNINKIVKSARQVLVAQKQMKSIKLQPVVVVQAIEEALGTFVSCLQDKEISLEFRDDAAEGATVIAAPVPLVHSVLCNILSNAVKFSRRYSKIEVISRSTPETVTLTIRDHGIGMNQRMVDGLFSFGHEISRKGTEGEVGTGLGMKVMRRFMREFGGDVRATSTSEQQSPDDHGTTFELIFQRGGGASGRTQFMPREQHSLSEVSR